MYINNTNVHWLVLLIIFDIEFARPILSVKFDKCHFAAYHMYV